MFSFYNIEGILDPPDFPTDKPEGTTVINLLFPELLGKYFKMHPEKDSHLDVQELSLEHSGRLWPDSKSPGNRAFKDSELFGRRMTNEVTKDKTIALLRLG